MLNKKSIRNLGEDSIGEKERGTNCQESRAGNLDTLQKLFEILQNKGYQIVGPKVQDSKFINYEFIQRVEELPMGWTDRQEPGIYTIQKVEKDHNFHFNCSPQSWKKFLTPPREKIFKAALSLEGEISIEESQAVFPKLVFLGVRACELSAILIQDKIYNQSDHYDENYIRRRENILIIAVDCSKSSNTCFCTSMEQGPMASKGYDLAITELMDHGGKLLFRSGSDIGGQLLDDLVLLEQRFARASEEENKAAEKQKQNVVDSINRRMDIEATKTNLTKSANDSLWEKVATSCLACANCTMSCPTCFCTTIDDVTDLSGTNTERWKRWDSCFNLEFSYIHGGSIRKSISSRYRQWISHKLVFWHGQFGSSGCVGCGRCITWCPVGIDLTQLAQEAVTNAIQEKQGLVKRNKK